MKSKHEPAYQFVDTFAALEETVRLMEKEPVVAVDLEADSMYHFAEKVCLIQMATRDINVIIDPLLIDDMSPLIPLFSNPDIQKVLHGADYDVRSLYRDFRIRIENLFDTQIACRFLAVAETGLNAVLSSRYHISLNKKFQKKDWSKRPLPAEMLAYASEDAIYLLRLAEDLQKELVQNNRLEWVHEECRLLSRVRPAKPTEDPLFVKFKGAGRLDPRALVFLEALLAFRQKAARKKDRPPFKVFSNTSILKIIQARPVNLQQLEAAGAFSRRQLEMYGNAVVDVVAGALNVPESDLKPYPRQKTAPIRMAARRRIQTLKAWRDRKAQQLGLEPALLCSKNAMADVAVQNPDTIGRLCQIETLKDWQKNVLGEEIMAVLKKGDGRKN